MKPQLLTYEQVNARLGDKARLLIGNGFSIACCPDIFTYGALFEEADFSALSPHAKSVFDALNTRDFELVIKALEEAAVIARHYGYSDPDVIATLEADAKGLKDQLARTIAKRHPEHPSIIDETKYRACREFLAVYKGIYSLNYDLLLYWTIMRDDPGLPPIHSDDGFRRGDLGPCGYVKWDPHEAPSQSIHYMHGALHLFGRGDEFVKFTWTNTDVRLIEQIRAALEEGRFPRIVSEGTSSAKLDRITHCAYLHKALRSLMSIGGELVIFGMALTENDEHVLDCIVHGSVERLYVSIYGDPASEANQGIIERAEALATKRRIANEKKGSREKKRELSISFFDAQSAKVWG